MDKISVVICCYTQERWNLLLAAISSVPIGADCELIVVVDHNPLLFDELATNHVGAKLVVNIEDRGISGARNSGIRSATGDIIVFLDDDAKGNEGWINTLIAAFAEPAVVAAGLAVMPSWESKPGKWLPESFLWTVGCSWLGLPQVNAEVRNVIGACMAFRRSALASLGGFDQRLGRKGLVPLGCDETELCIRARDLGSVIYIPENYVEHFVPAKRVTFRYFASRCWGEGLSKAVVSYLVGTKQSLGSEVRHFSVMGGECAHAFREGNVGRIGAIVAGTALTVCGFMWGQLFVRSSKGRRTFLVT